jgi:O-antigen/teichoic acid export membrane protein
MTRSNRFLYGVSWGYVNQLVMAAAGLYLTRFYLGALGGSIYGLWIVGLQLLAYLTLLDLGVVALVPRETAYALGNDRRELPRLIGETLSIAVWQMPIIALLALVAWWSLPADWSALRGPVALTFAVFVASFPLRAFPAVLQGLQDFSFLGKLHFLTWALGTAASVAGLKAGLGLYALGVGWIVTTLALQIGSFLRLRAVFAADLPARLLRPSLQAVKGRLSKSVWVTVSQVSQVLLVGTDILILGKLLGPTAVVLYSCTGKLVQLLVNQPQTLTQAALPGLAELKSTKDLPAIRRVSEALILMVMLASGAIVVTVTAVNGGFVRWWVGESQYGGAALTLLLVTNMAIRHFTTTLVFSLFCFGHEKAIALIGLADGLLTLALSLVLTPKLGLAGPAVAALTSGLLISLPQVGKRLAAELEVKFLELARPLIGWSWRFAILAAVSVGILRTLMPTPWAVAGAAAAVGAAYALLMVPVVRASVLMRYLEPAWDRTVGARLRRAR